MHSIVYCFLLFLLCISCQSQKDIVHTYVHETAQSQATIVLYRNFTFKEKRTTDGKRQKLFGEWKYQDPLKSTITTTTLRSGSQIFTLTPSHTYSIKGDSLQLITK